MISIGDWRFPSLATGNSLCQLSGPEFEKNKKIVTDLKKKVTGPEICHLQKKLCPDRADRQSKYTNIDFII